MLFGPIYALINLFICILRDPNHSRVDAALSLLDVGAGFFARLKIASNSTISIQFAKQLALLAHAVVERNAKGLAGADYFPERLGRCDQSPVLRDDELVHNVNGNHMQPPVFTPNGLSDYLDLELDDWSTFLPMEGGDDESLFGLAEPNSSLYTNY